jgi:hypothetical protein
MMINAPKVQKMIVPARCSANERCLCLVERLIGRIGHRSAQTQRKGPFCNGPFQRQGRCRVPPRSHGVTVLLHGLPMQRQIEAFAFDLVGHPQSDHEIHGFEDHERNHDVIDDHDDNPLGLVDHLHGVAFDQS